MATQFRSLNGTWHVATDEALVSGATVSVTRRNGQVSQVIIGRLISVDHDRDLPRLYAFEDLRRASGAQAETRIVTVPAAQSLFERFTRATELNRAFAVRFALNATARGLRFELAAPSSRYAGQLLALSEQRTGRNRRALYGTLSREGNFAGRVGATQVELEIFNEVAETLVNFAVDPAGYSASRGREAGACCYCGRGLTDERSLRVGYGPTCADHFGLPWGEAPNRTQETTQTIAAPNETVPTVEDIQNEPDPALRAAMALNRASAGLPPIGQRNAMGQLISATPEPPPGAHGVVTQTYRRSRPAPPSPEASADRIRNRFRERLARRQATTTETPRDETTTTVQRTHQRRDPLAPLEEDDFIWPPRNSE